MSTRRGIAFTVLGHPEPAGSKSAFAIRKGGVPTGQIAVSDANPRAKGWKREVALAARQAYTGELLTGPLELALRFYLKRPKGHYGTGRNADTIKASAPDYPTVKPDVLKLARGVEDALSGVLYGDDALIVWEVLSKDYGTPERCEVTLRSVWMGAGAAPSVRAVRGLVGEEAA